MKRRILVLGAAFLCIVSACQKEDSTSSAGTDISGNYKFVSMQAKTTSTVQSGSGSSVDKTVTTSDYTSQNNSGTVTIDASRIISSNIAYSINSSAKSTVYENGAVTDTFSFPFQVTLPASSGTTTYKRIGSDSLYFATGSILMSGSATASNPGGAKFTLVNGKLTISSNSVQSSTITDQGTTATTLANITSVITLQKQ